MLQRLNDDVASGTKIKIEDFVINLALSMGGNGVFFMVMLSIVARIEDLIRG